MFLNGVPDVDRQGREHKTGLLIGRAKGAAEIRTTDSGKQVASLNLRAYGRKDGTAVFMTVKAWDAGIIDQLHFVSEGDMVLAAGRLSFREYNGKTYIDLTAEFLSIQKGASAVPAAMPPIFDSLPDSEEDGELPF